MAPRERGELWAVTCHFNPAGFAVRSENFRRFRDALQVPLAAAELAFDGPFELKPRDADILIQHRTSDVFWHKEALLMAAVRKLPPECRWVAWLDADIVFQRPDWPSAAAQALSQYPVVQLFEKVHHMPPHWKEKGQEASPVFSQVSLSGALQAGAKPRDLLDLVLPRSAESWAIGHAWAADRRVLERYELYRGSIMGGGDTAFAAAVLGYPQIAVAMHMMNGPQAAFYQAWAEPVARGIGGKVGGVGGEIYHLWHGTMESRRSQARHAALANSGFDPFADLEPDPLGCWRWRRPRPNLKELLESYFAGRGEDGRIREAAAK